MLCLFGIFRFFFWRSWRGDRQGLQKVACRRHARVFVAKRLRPEEAHGLVTNTGAGRGDYLRKAWLPAKNVIKYRDRTNYCCL